MTDFAYYVIPETVLIILLGQLNANSSRNIRDLRWFCAFGFFTVEVFACLSIVANPILSILSDARNEMDAVDWRFSQLAVVGFWEIACVTIFLLFLWEKWSPSKATFIVVVCIGVITSDVVALYIMSPGPMVPASEMMALTRGVDYSRFKTLSFLFIICTILFATPTATPTKPAE